jgi:hypothetical protein
MYGVAGYHPVPCTTVDHVREHHGQRLRNLTGRQLLESEYTFVRADDGRRRTGWLLRGLEFRFAKEKDRALQLWNRYSELTVATDEPGTGRHDDVWRAHPL